MTTLTTFKRAGQQQLTLDQLLAVIEREEMGAVIPDNGLCPYMQECYRGLDLVRQHCAWNLDAPPTWQWCGGYKRRKRG
jgi:hypothetical protein